MREDGDYAKLWTRASFLASSFPQNTMAEGTPHYVAFRVPARPTLHMTVCYIHALRDDEKQALAADVAALKADLGPVIALLGERAMFGDKSDIPVIRVVLSTGDDARLRLFYSRWYRPDPGKVARPEPTWHISCPVDAFAGQTSLVLEDLYVKEIKRHV